MHQQQQAQPQLLQQVLLAGSRAASGSLADCSSNSSSPMRRVSASLLSTPGVAAALGKGPLGQLGCHHSANAPVPVSVLFGGAHTAPSPTFSNSSNTSGFGERAVYQT
ncbi:hypothetical protein COO60DRAFT_1640781 [Scenedesmus sp. NREL 46B-D3]|nr:hypothetical protein COO60DRAFT_1640781 [Scenedesmus sp. NREL 46B-D3]